VGEGDLRFIFYMSFLVQEIVKFGISEETIALVLMLPVVATFIAFCRQVIGIRGLGIYITSLIAFAFVETQIKYGIVIFFVVLFSGTFMRFLMKKARIQYLPRMAIVLTGVSFSIFLMFFLGTYFKIEGLRVISIFPILMMILLTERFVAIQIERGQKMAILLVSETLVLAIVSYFIINSVYLRNILLSWPIASLCVIFLFNFALGKWTGFRITEYFRFRELMDYLSKK